MSQKETEYRQRKMEFLDGLQPDDFRNGGSFNQAEIIIDELNEGLYKATKNKKNPEEFIAKAVSHLFRDGSPAIGKAIELAWVYIGMKR
jgi:hypothetical protein